MRQRTKMNGLVSHTTPNGKSCSSSKNKCEMQLKKLQKLLDGGYKLAGIKKESAKTSEENENFKIVMVFGKPMKLTIQEYNDHWTFTVQK